jgi:protein-tyrosine phosphatase
MTTPTGDFHVLTVCLGNVCRSPLMERLLQARLPEGFVVRSAGLTSLAGHPMEQNAAAELVRLQGSPDGFIAREFIAKYADRADLVLTATTEIRSRVLTESPGALRRAFTLLELAHLVQSAPADLDGPKAVVAWAAANRSTAAGVPADVPDPIGRGSDVHRAAADLIDGATRQIATALTRAVSGAVAANLDR